MSINDLLNDEVFLMALLITFAVLAIGVLIFNYYIHSKQAEQDLVNSLKPIETKKAKVMTKTMSPNNMQGHIVFEFENGERKEFLVNRENFRMLVEHDVGQLKTQGTKFISFEREVDTNEQ